MLSDARSDALGLAGPVIVTGANGFIGRHLCRHLAASGVDIHAVVRETTSRTVRFPTGVTVHAVRDATVEYPAVAAEVRPQVVFHLATLFAARHAASEIVRMIDANVAFGTVVCDASSQGGARVVHTTSAWQHYGGGAYSPVSLYAATKQALCDVITYFAEVEGLFAREVCLFDTYGPDDDRKKLVSVLLEAASTGARLPMSSGHQLTDLTHVEDVVAALVHVAVGDPPPTRLVARSGQPLSIRALVGLVEQVTGRSVNAEWNVLDARPREMTDDWPVEAALTRWRPLVNLPAGLAQLWAERTHERD
ncbi:MAG: NAD(P)-dependent oxidoreductase [Phycicoccus sp.]|nr:NAD(P)-dependent oxidoreductase [Phycicoccus sp.]